MLRRGKPRTAAAGEVAKVLRSEGQPALGYDVVVVGSGYGGAIAASRFARAGRSVCVLERGGGTMARRVPGDRNGRSDLRLAAAEVTRGRFVHPPPDTIAAGTRARVWIQDDLGPFGSSGAVRHVGDDGSSLVIEASCPTGFSANRCRSTAPFVARSGNRPAGADGDVPALGHPLVVTVRTP